MEEWIDNRLLWQVLAAHGRGNLPTSATRPPSSFLPTDTSRSTMAGSKRNKIRKALSPTKNLSPPAPPIVDDDDLMDDLFAQLDSKEKSAQQQSAEILKDANIDSVADDLEKEDRKDSKSRFKARQVCLFRILWSCSHKLLSLGWNRRGRLLRWPNSMHPQTRMQMPDLSVKLVKKNGQSHRHATSSVSRWSRCVLCTISQPSYV